ncbi:hypothetical protein U8607_23535 [Methylobacterium durans]|uniref:hypothetical protein n=1 Tax=Methylobacterium durans TaxID=2202825 RepID=UPI002AFEC19B|nr:hypothetical protein [Methylobacterium durans]MEA1835066.1 hypothetical protein [Methylobacterium durans]
MAQQIQPDRPIWPSIPETGLPPRHAPLDKGADRARTSATGLGGPLPPAPQGQPVRAPASDGFASFES